jgi:membrane protease subunit HflK
MMAPRIGALPRDGTIFPPPRTYNGRMIDNIGRVDRDTTPVTHSGALLNEEGPWGGRAASDASGGASGGNGEGGTGDDDAPRNPWTQPPRRKPRPVRTGASTQPSIEELIRRGRERFGGKLPSGGFGQGFGGRPIWGYAFAAFLALWLATTSVHRIDPQERGVITRFGAYAGTLKPGIGLTLPAPIDVVSRVNVDQIQSFDVPASGGQNLVLTGDQNIVDLAYSVRWSIRDPERYLFELADPEDTIREIAESAMREELSRVTLDQAIGPMRGEIEARVALRIQALLDRYHSGVLVQGVAIRQADPPAAVMDAFKDVSAAQQQAQGFLNQAHTYAEQVTANAVAQAQAFDKVYGAYKLAPDVTKKRMYYETMEAVLGKTNKVIVDTPGANVYLPGTTPLPKAAPAAPAAGAGQ